VWCGGVCERHGVQANVVTNRSKRVRGSGVEPRKPGAGVVRSRYAVPVAPFTEQREPMELVSTALYSVKAAVCGNRARQVSVPPVVTNETITILSIEPERRRTAMTRNIAADAPRAQAAYGKWGGGVVQAQRRRYGRR